MDGAANLGGKVYLVGAGPGDPGLITARGLSCLARADVVLYDYLANPRILSAVPKHAELICLGKHGQTRIWSQAEINQRIGELATAGKTVVRLKNGDPAVFARGAEEIESLLQANLDFEIVPGITTALAAGSYAGIPVTHRGLASAVALITGQENDAKPDSSLDYEALARFPGTLVVYMGVTTAPAWTAALIAAGKPADTPAAIIRRCSLPDQTTVCCRLDGVAQRIAEEAIRPPVIVIVGPVTQLAERFNWFDRRPLSGKRVLVTRPPHQAGRLRDLLEDLGAAVEIEPAILIEPLADWTLLDEAIQRLANFDWLVFSSANGVRAFFQRLFDTGRDLRAVASLKLATIGPGTTDELKRFHLQSDLQPETYRAEALAEVLSRHAAGQRFLLARASRGREVLAEQIQAAGGQVEQVVVYQSLDAVAIREQIQRDLDAGAFDYVTVTSSAIARSLVGLVGERLKQTRLASISPVTSATLRQLGYEPEVEAEAYTMEGLVSAIRRDAEA
jgi:uroporphyrinogen III methyltransferase/synthase